MNLIISHMERIAYDIQLQYKLNFNIKVFHKIDNTHKFKFELLQFLDSSSPSAKFT